MYQAHEKDAFAVGSLRLQDNRNLILQLSEHYPVLFIIIDALDECNPATRQNLLDAVDFILQQSPSLTKIFISSRDGQDIVYKLREYPNLELSSDRNSPDIAKFVKRETSSLVAKGTLLPFIRMKQELQQKIIEKVTNGAGGM